MDVSVTFIAVGLLKSKCPAWRASGGRLRAEGVEGQRLDDACRQLGLPMALISLFVINGKAQSGTYVLRPDDEVKCIALVGGG